MNRIRPLLPVAVAALALTGCAGSSAPAAPSPAASTAISTPSASASATPTAGRRPTLPAVDQTIHITYAGGKVSGVSAVVKVKQNSTVALIVTSDVADEVHLHGYNKMADVTKGGTVTIVFKATLPGKWEVELEKLKHRLVFLQVQ